GRDLAQAVLAIGAMRAFRCAAALRPPLDDGESTVKWALRLGALALVARQTDAFVRWWDVRTGVSDLVRQTGQSLDAEPWEPYARGTLWMAWLGLLGAPPSILPHGEIGRIADGEFPVLTATRNRLATFRERRAEHDMPAE